MTLTIYKTLIAKIKATLTDVAEISEVFDYPASETEITKYPCAVFFPDSVDNAFETNNQDLRTYKFKLYIVAGGENITASKLFGDVLAGAMDGVMEAFAKDWNGGTIEGNRVWVKINTGIWSMRADGNEATCELSIDIKLITNN